MASFMEDLWSSIFTPGPTPTLLIATNVTFAALHGGLWWSINWFAAEVRLAQLAQETEKEKQEEADANTRKSPAVGESADSDTETEALDVKKADDKSSAVATGSASSGLLPTARDPKKRPSTRGEGSGYGSTDSEWEKVDDTQS
ncbi:Endoplasmic reticulum protein Pkr1 [Penicillium expansum]|nr:Endoplasmic reticulum protein Pkr1 [Penicillium expansum]